MSFTINGHVVDASGAALPGLRVEAWDKDIGADDYLGTAETQADGSFTISFSEEAFQDFFDFRPDVYFKILHCGAHLHSTEDSIIWNAANPTNVTIVVTGKIHPYPCGERHIYLKIERIEEYSPVFPQPKVAPPMHYGRDCMRNEGHENGLIPQAEIQARSLTAIVYREYLDAAYLVPKPDKLILADINEPAYPHRVPGTVIYTRPCERLKIHVWNCDDVSHSMHVHGLRYGIGSDGSWPFGTEAAHHGGRSDAICPGHTWTYTFDVTSEMYGCWPFHDHTMHHDMRIDQGLFGGFVVLRPCDAPPRPFRLPPRFLEDLYEGLERIEKRPFVMGKGDQALRLRPEIHAKMLRPDARRFLRDQLEFLHEFAVRELALPKRRRSTDHVPVFFHIMTSRDAKPVFDSGDLEEFTGVFQFTFGAAGDFEYFCQHHPVMTGTVHVEAGGPATATVNIVDAPAMGFSPQIVTIGVGGTVEWRNLSMHHHTVTSRDGAAMTTHCINGRGFTGNSPTIVARADQRIRWYVFNLDTSTNWHNFHPHAMRWKFGGENIDGRSMGPAESFVVEAHVPPVLLLDDEMKKMQDPSTRPKDAKLYHLKGDFVFHCHVHHHMMNGMVGLVRSQQSLWLTPDYAHQLSHRTGLPVDDGTNTCPEVDHHPCSKKGSGRWEAIAGNPEVTFMHSVLLPNTKKVLYWGYTRADQSRVWDYSTPVGAFSLPANQPADEVGGNINTSDMWSAEHTFLNTAEGHALIHGGFSPQNAYEFNPATLRWTLVQPTALNRFYSTTLTVADGRAITIIGQGGKSIEAYTRGVGWAPQINLPASMNHHLYYPWSYLLPNGQVFIAGPHVPTQLIDWPSATVLNTFATIAGERSTGGEKGTSVLLMLRPPDYKPIAYIIGGDPVPARQTAEQIDLSAAAPAWSALPNLNLARPQQFTATLLPDGRVFIAGGVSGGADGGVCETFDPKDPAAGWVAGPPMTHSRTYHSSFILLSDGSVVGGGDPGGAGGPTPHERFFPDYFTVPRPSITNAPASASWGANFAVDTPTAAGVAEVILLRPGAVTHGFNMSQRGVECVFVQGGANSLNVTAPPDGNVAPPGWYLLFILDGNRVPSEGRWIRLVP